MAENILYKADQIVNYRSEEEEREYGPLSKGMERASEIYNVISPDDEFITPEGMFRAMIALKLSREAYKHKEDNLLDCVAYIGGLNNYINENYGNK